VTFLLIGITALTILASMGFAYFRTRDALHPMLILGGMLLYVFVWRPAVLIGSGALLKYVTPDQILFGQTLFTLGVVALCWGILYRTPRKTGRVRFEVSTRTQRRMVEVACVLGTLALSSYWFAIWNSGGFVKVYSHAKAHMSTGSGWFNEMVNLAIPAAALMVLAWQAKRSSPHYLFLAILFASPVLTTGLLGARRGPTFIISATLLVAWYVGAKRRVALWKILIGFGTLGLLLIFLITHRREIHLGSTEVSFNVDSVFSRLVQTEVTPSDDTVFMFGYVNGIREKNAHLWGLRYIATYLVRPIPRQIWPTKYQDLGLGWMASGRDLGGITKADWREVLGWVPRQGSAIGFVGDLFLEFSWFGLIGCYFIGRFFNALWDRGRVRGGLWTLLYVEAAALTVFVPTQSISAVFHRFLLMALPTLLIWRLHIGAGESGHSAAALRRLRLRTARP